MDIGPKNHYGFTPEEVEIIKKFVLIAINNKIPLEQIFPGEERLAQEAAFLYLLLTNPQAKWIFGCNPQPFDSRDLLSTYIVTEPTETLRPIVDLSKFCSPVESQGSLGSCSACAAIGAIEMLEQEKKEYNDKSKLFLYYNTRLLMGTVDEDSGAYLRDVLKALNKFGVCKEIYWPYDLTKWKTKPDKKCYDDAINYRIQKYILLPEGNVSEACKILNMNLPVIFGAFCFNSILSKDAMQTGIIEMPDPKEETQGGHALCCLPDTIITTKNGFKYIKDIKKNDEVLTHTGNFKKVTNVLTRQIDENILELKGINGEILGITKEHPILTENYNWVKAQDIQNNDKIYSSFCSKELTFDKIIYEHNFFLLLGIYMAVGSNENKTIIKFALDKQNFVLVNKCLHILNKYANITKIKFLSTDEQFIIFCEDDVIINQINNMFNGSNFTEKLLFAPIELQKSFLKGILLSNSNDLNDKKFLILSDINLKESLLFILKRLKIIFDIKKRDEEIIWVDNEPYKTQNSYYIRFYNIDNNFNINIDAMYINNLFISKMERIREIKYKGIVYNLEVAEDNSYVANGIVVHNCLVGYDLQTQYFKFRNSWGIWGDNGYGYMPFEYYAKYTFNPWAIMGV